VRVKLVESRYYLAKIRKPQVTFALMVKIKVKFKNRLIE